MNTTYKPREGVYSPTLQCFVTGIEIADCDTVLFRLDPYQCCDMPGAIRVASAILPDVSRIICFNPELDALYLLGVGGWKSTLVRPAAEISA